MALRSHVCVRSSILLQAPMEATHRATKTICRAVMLIRILKTKIYSKTCLKRPLTNRKKTKVLKTNGSLMKVESIAECSLGAFCNTFDLH